MSKNTIDTSVKSSQLPQLLQQKNFEHIVKLSQQITVPASSTVFRQGDACENYLMVIEGSVKVFSRAENGREIILYRVKDGESCTLTTACLFGRNLYPAEGITETEVSALMIPRDVFNQGLADSEAFRKMIFDQYAKRLSDVISLVESLSFSRIDIRLANLLIQLSETSDTIEATHQVIATELGSAREVISRHLKEFEHKGFISLQRGSITIMNAQALHTLSNTPQV